MLTDLTFNSSDGNLIELGNYGKRKKVVDRKMSYKLEAKTDKNFQRWTSEIEDRLWSQMNLVKAGNHIGICSRFKFYLHIKYNIFFRKCNENFKKTD